MNKFKAFFIKLWNNLKKFPVFMCIAVFLPASIYTVRSMFMMDHYYFNLNYDGEQLKINPYTFKLKKINPLFKIMDISSYSNYQGGACYKNYYALCSNNFECIIIYNMNTRKVEDTIFTGMTNTEYHCNTCFFGSTFYTSTDKYPLLYISMENEGVESTFAYRINQNAASQKIVQVQEIHLASKGENKLYYPNSYYDYETQMLYYSGYTQKSYKKSDDNILRYYSFELPDYRITKVDLDPEAAHEVFELPSETATQGGFISHGFLYQTFSFNSNTDINNAPKMRIVDLRDHKIVYDVQNLGEYGVYDEFENIAYCADGHIYGFGIRSLNIFDFEFEAEAIKD